jgi:hypothetical protein
MTKRPFTGQQSGDVSKWVSNNDDVLSKRKASGLGMSTNIQNRTIMWQIPLKLLGGLATGK